MSCFSSSTSSTPYQDVYTAHDTVINVKEGQDVTKAYDQFRSALWSVIEVAADAHAFELSWNTLEKFGKSQLIEYQITGNPAALVNLKGYVKSAVENMP